MGIEEQQVIFRKAVLSDTLAIARIYREGFPGYTSSMLGDGYCNEYFKYLLSRQAYETIVAIQKGCISGFAVLHMGVTQSLDRKWIFKSSKAMVAIINLCLRKPLFVAKRVCILLVKRVRLLGNRLHKNLTPTSQGKFAIPSARLQMVAVAKESRGSGLGRGIVNYCVNYVSECGLKTIKLGVEKNNSVAIRLYESMGFERIGEEGNLYYYRLLLNPHHTI